MKDKILFIILGPTAVGKTDLSINIAKKLNAEIFSCDSRQFFKELNIGVAKPNEYQLKEIKHHFIGNVSVTNHYSISKYEQDFIKESENYFKNNDIALMVGGSGLYIDAICNGVDEMPDHDENIRNEVNEFYKINGLAALRNIVKKIDPEFYAKADKNNPQRLIRALEIYKQTGKKFSEFRKEKKTLRNFRIIKIGTDLDRNLLYEKANIRVDKMIEDGLLDEVIGLKPFRNLVPLKTIGYKELFSYIDNNISFEEAVDLIKRNTRHYIRRQITWFRRYDDIKWFNINKTDEIISYIYKNLNL